MALEKITKVSGKAVYVAGEDIDTDRIIPARFMKCVTFDGLGEYMFYDVRFGEDGTPKKHILNEERYKDASILLANSNFGCGSSREHAPQAIYRYGFRAVIAESFAEIFYGNSITLGMPCVEASRLTIEAIAAAVEANPSTEVTIDIVNSTVTFNDQTLAITVKQTSQDALVNGMWDPIAELLEGEPQVTEVAAGLPYMGVTK